MEQWIIVDLQECAFEAFKAVSMERAKNRGKSKSTIDQIIPLSDSLEALICDTASGGEVRESNHRLPSTRSGAVSSHSSGLIDHGLFDYSKNSSARESLIDLNLFSV